MHNFLGSTKQQSIALSSINFEYMDVAKAIVEVIWLWKLVIKLGFPQKDLIIIYSNSQNAITLSEDAKYHSRSKHIGHIISMFYKGKNT
jgi:hypothetical protein